MTSRFLGHGIGLRTAHYGALFSVPERHPGIDWLEIISENFLGPGGRPRAMLRAAQARYPLAMHGVAMSLGSSDPLNRDHLHRLRALAHEIQPAFISEHLCWGSHGGAYAHDLLPLPFTEEALEHVAGRIRFVQDFLDRPLLIENISSYLCFSHSTLTEWEFLTELCERTDCLLLLDVNNIFVSAHNHGFDPLAFVHGVPAERIAQIHIAGHRAQGQLLLDTHDHPIRPEVWALYRATLMRAGPVSTLIEWDEAIPPLEEVVAQARMAASVCAACTAATSLTTPTETTPAVPKRERLPPAKGALSLLDAQTRLWTVITAHERVSEALYARGLTPEFITTFVAGDDKLDALGRADIYNGMYFLRILDFIKEDYPALLAVLGDEQFATLCAAFLAARPNRSPFARDAGAELPEFLSEWASARSAPTWWVDLARLEWARADLYDAADARTLTMAEVQKLGAEDLPQLPLLMVPAHRLLACTHAITPVWNALIEGGQDALPVPEATPTHVLVWRRGEAVLHRPLTGEEHTAVAALRTGTTFSSLCEHLAYTPDGRERDLQDAARLAVAWLARWLSDGLIVTPAAGASSSDGACPA